MKEYCANCGLLDTFNPDTEVPSSLLEEPRDGEKRIAVIGEAPGSSEVSEGIPFQGMSGRLVRSVLEESGINIDRVFFANACRCKTPAGRTPSTNEITCCRNILITELMKFKPDMILTCGSTATKAVIGKDANINAMRGKWFHDGLTGATIIPTLHPGSILSKPEFFPYLAQDIDKLTREVPNRISPITMAPTNKKDCLALLNKYVCKFVKDFGPYRSYDIETVGLIPKFGRILSLCFSPCPDISFIIPAEYLQDRDIVDAINKGFAHKDMIWCGHNSIMFDEPWLRTIGIAPRTDIDTMLCHYLTDGRNNIHKIEQVAMELFGTENWKLKEEQLKAMDKIPEAELFSYASMDTAVGVAIAPVMDSRMRKDSQYKVYNETIVPAAHALGRIQQKGILIDVVRLEKVNEFVDGRIERLTAIVRGKNDLPKLNINSSKQIAKLLFETLELPVIKRSKKTGEPSTDKSVIEELAKKFDDPTLLKIKDVRSLQTMQSNAIKGILENIDPDGRLRTSFKIHGTETGRLSSSDPNLQNIPVHSYVGKRIRECFIASPGKKLIELDYSQLELRVMAWYSQDEALLKEFSTGVDIHKAVAATMFNVLVENVTSDQRFKAKSTDFGAIYGKQGDTPEEKELIRNFLDKYPKVKELIENTQQFVKDNGYIETYFGRRRRFPFLPPDWKSMQEIMRECVNTLIQSTASDICLRALTRLDKAFKFTEYVDILLTVHDSILIEVDEDRVEDMIPAFVEEMEKPITSKDGVKFVIDYKVGNNWGELKD